MKKLALFIIIIFLFLPIYCLASDEWTKEDTIYECIFLGVTAIDWMQTLEIVKENHCESNPILGEHPSHMRVNTLIPMAMFGHAFVAYILPSEYILYGFKIYPRRTWQVFYIGVETGAIFHNYNCGIRIHF